MGKEADQVFKKHALKTAEVPPIPLQASTCATRTPTYVVLRRQILSGQHATELS
jgi:hypothetical protein